MEKLPAPPVPLDLMELSPQEATFTVSGFDKPLTLCRWTLRVRNWAAQKYGSARLAEIFKNLEISPIADMAFFMLKEKNYFKNQDEFLDAIVSTKDQLSLCNALLESLGIGEPERQKIKASLEGKEPGPADPNE